MTHRKCLKLPGGRAEGTGGDREEGGREARASRPDAPEDRLGLFGRSPGSRVTPGSCSLLRARGPEPPVPAGPHGARRWAPPGRGGRGGSRASTPSLRAGRRRPPTPGLPTPLHRSDPHIRRAQHTQAPHKSDDGETGSENPGVLLNSNFENVGEAGHCHSSPAPQKVESLENLLAPASSAPDSPPAPMRGSGWAAGLQAAESQEGQSHCGDCVLPSILGPNATL